MQEMIERLRERLRCDSASSTATSIGTISGNSHRIAPRLYFCHSGCVDEVVRACGLTKRFGDVTAVDAIDVVVRAGERVGLLGPNGAGKTTTLLMLLGVVAPDDGWIEVAGRRLPKGRSAAMAEVGFAAGYLPLPERLKVDEYLRFYGQLYGLPDPDIDAALDRFGIGHLAGARGTDLSSGQRTLVGIVKAILHGPRLLVLDEPTASLDPDVAMRVRTGLQDLCRDEGTTLLVTSHNMVEVERMCDRVVFIAAGRVVADGSPADVAASFGGADLESVFLRLAGRDVPEHPLERSQETERPAG
jgi:ABC-2 type transport system ATP-binding protein